MPHKRPLVTSAAVIEGLGSDFIRVRGRRSKEANKLFTSRRPLDPNRITRESMPWISGRLPPQDLREILKEDPFYKKAVASGLEVKLGRCSWSAKAKEHLF
ncbi:hypothetical protein HanXRQr2_Chr10g0461621 [Helianthus annuus]|uniref:Uncharacterized protein n=1 Tax=Helianthus annuus TaxID=4232 RepID=A0A251TP04_HELAN|nr:uncharacterized protein LOC110883340 [Helianthus annuus]KAF5788221.1 hypothetical protein HanXRQr2_Chr10g0461621 [Helianthus annuus]KAJ0885466.1 hypothetical protein HanPSC8_Chr10g0445541 [Helianthus annuus]